MRARAQLDTIFCVCVPDTQPVVQMLMPRMLPAATAARWSVACRRVSGGGDGWMYVRASPYIVNLPAQHCVTRVN